MSSNDMDSRPLCECPISSQPQTSEGSVISGMSWATHDGHLHGVAGGVGQVTEQDQGMVLGQRPGVWQVAQL